MVPDTAATLQSPSCSSGSARAVLGTAGMAGYGHFTSRAPVNAAALSRKIIYDAEVDLVVKDVDPIGKRS